MIYERIKAVLDKKEPVAVTLLCPGDGTVQMGVVSPVEIIPATGEKG
jgi:hypothetical protein